MFSAFHSSVLVVALVLSSLTFGQSKDDTPCYEVKHLDFFGLKDLEVPKWPDSEIDGLNELVIKGQKRDTSLNVNFTVPLIAYQLQELHPSCAENADTNYLTRIIELYGVIRKFNAEKLTELSLIDQIDFIRDDFYDLLKDDKNLIGLSFTLDDGPFYGVDSDSIGEVSESIESQFGKLVISTFEGQGILTAADKNDNVIWRKSITGLQDRKLGEITSQIYAIRETSLATVFNLYASGERLTLYVKNDGRFMYYFHSW